MTILQNIVPSQITDLKTFLKLNRCWVYASGNASTLSPSNLDNPDIYQRAYINVSKNLEYKRLATDKTNNGLRPRIEIVYPQERLPKNKIYHIRYEVCLLKGKDTMRGMIFQIMDHSSTEGTLPVTQFEVRDNILYSRYTDISSDGRNLDTHIKSIAPAVFSSTNWYNLDMYIHLSNDPSKGQIKNYLNGKLVFERRGITCSKDALAPQIQCGIYAVGGVELKTQVRKLMWESIDRMPTTTTL